MAKNISLKTNMKLKIISRIHTKQFFIFFIFLKPQPNEKKNEKNSYQIAFLLDVSTKHML